MRTAASTRIIATTPDGVMAEIQIQNFPHDPASGRACADGSTVYDVPAGVSVVTYDPALCRSVLKPVVSFTIDKNKETSRVETSLGYAVEVSRNESLVVYNHNTCELEKRAPAGAEGMLVPVVARFPVVGDLHGYDFGWVCGAFAGDGFLTGNNFDRIGFTKLDAKVRSTFEARLTGIVADFGVEVRKSRDYRGNVESGGLGDSVKNHFVIGYDAFCFFREAFYANVDRDGRRSAHYKCLPPFMDWSEEARIGLLAGLLDSDGSVALNVAKARAKKQLIINYATSSVFLRDDIIRLCTSLGIRATYSTTKAKPGRLQLFDSFTVNISTTGLQRYADRLKLVTAHKAENLTLLNEVCYDQRDYVPVPTDVVLNLCSATGLLAENPKARASWQTIRSKSKGVYRITRDLAKRTLEQCAAAEVLPDVFIAWAGLVNDETTRWDYITKVEDAETMTTYDLGVPGPKTFAVNGGLVIQDTINIHAPADQTAVDDIKRTLLPSKNLLSPATFEAHMLPDVDIAHGIWLAGKKRSSRAPRVFKDEDAAVAAYMRGEIGATDPIRIAGSGK